MKLGLNSFNIITGVFWFVVLYGGTTGVGYINGYNGGFYIEYVIWTFLRKGRPVSNGFLGVEIVILFYSFYLFIKFRKGYTIDKRNFKMLILSIIVFIFILINPNNQATLLQSFLGKDSKFILLFPIFFSAIAFLSPTYYIPFIKKFIKIGILITVVKSVIAFVFYITGNGIRLELERKLYQTTMPMSDYLQFLGFFSSLLFLFFLLYRDKKVLILSLFIFLVMILSFRRTDPISTFVCLFSIVVYYSFYIGSIKSFTKTFMSVALLISVLLFITVIFTNIKVSTLTNRMLVAFSYFDEDLGSNEFSDTGHINQSVETTRTLFSNLGQFWGGGLQSKAFYVEGQSPAAAHNSIALAWAKQGLFAVIYLLLQFFWFVFLMTELISNQRKYFPYFKLFRFFVLIQLIMYMVTGWSSGRYIFQGSPQDYVLFTIMFSLLKIKNNTVRFALTK